MKEQSRTIVGIDWSADSHTCYDLQTDKSFKIKDSVEGYEKLLKNYPEAVFVIEEANNRIGDYLLINNREVYVLPPCRSKEARKYHFSSGTKSDGLDAQAIALTFKEHPSYCLKARYSKVGVKITKLVTAYNIVSKTHSQQCTVKPQSHAVKKGAPMSPKNLARIFNKRSIVPTVCIVIVIVLLAGIFPPLTKAQAQREIASSLLQFIIRREIGATAAYIRSSGQPWVEAPPDANIIIWAPAWGYNSDLPGLSTQTPIQVWWYTDGNLIETQDQQASILEYQQRYMGNPKSNIWAWGHYAFGILSISRTRWLADVYVEVSCGPLCGHGFHYKLLRAPFGNWLIIKADHLWQA